MFDQIVSEQHTNIQHSNMFVSKYVTYVMVLSSVWCMEWVVFYRDEQQQQQK